MKKFLANSAKRVLNPVFKITRKKQDILKRHTERRYDGAWLGTSPITCSEDDLQIGDVLMCGSAIKSKNSYLITNASDGVYVHCAIYVGNGMIVDMVVPKIRKISLYELSQDYSYLTVVRCFGINNERQISILKFVDFCLEKGVKYNYLGAVLSPLKEYRNFKYHYIKQKGDSFDSRYETKKADKFFCSEFIVECFKNAGYVQKNSRIFESSNWTPTGLAEDNSIFKFVGFLNLTVLRFVDHKDPYLAGNEWVLTDEGQRQLAEQKLEFEKHVEKLKKQHSQKIT
ncbi:hypothetical protein ACTFQ6_14775 [Aliivibrio fischeri]